MIIGLNGEAGAGKDSVASVLINNFGYTRIAFADSLKEFAYALNPLVEGNIRVADVVDEIGWDEAKHKYPSVRKLLQDVGVTMREQISEDVWIRAAYGKIADAPTGDIVFTDLRFLNELQFLMGQNAVVVKVERPNNPFKIPATHISEQLRISTPYTITNDADSLESLACKVSAKMSEWDFKHGYVKKYLANETLLCNVCNRWKVLSEYPANNKTYWKVEYTCKSCTNDKSKNKPSRSPDARHEEYENRKDSQSKLDREKRLAKYGLSSSDYEILLEKQGGVCAICSKPETRTHHKTGTPFSLAVDHDHETGRVRGLLCTKCNKAIGALGDNHEIISKVIMYLEAGL